MYFQGTPFTFENSNLLRVGLRLYSQVFTNLQSDFEVFESCSIWTSSFFSIHEKYEKVSFLNITLCCTSTFFPNLLKSWKIGIFEVNFISCIVRL